MHREVRICLRYAEWKIANKLNVIESLTEKYKRVRYVLWWCDQQKLASIRSTKYGVHLECANGVESKRSLRLFFIGRKRCTLSETEETGGRRLRHSIWPNVICGPPPALCVEFDPKDIGCQRNGLSCAFLTNKLFRLCQNFTSWKSVRRWKPC